MTGGFAAILLLGACGSEETEQAEAETEEATEEETEESTEESTEEETTEESDTTEQAEAEGKEELAEEVEGDTEVAEEATDDKPTLYKEVGETLELDTVNLTVEEALVTKLEVNDMDAAMITQKEVQGGEEVDVLAIKYTLENTTEEPRTFFIDQSEIVTSTGEQIMPEMLLSEGLTPDMQGAVSSTGVVIYLLEEDTGENIEWLDVMLPMVADSEFNMYTEEQKYRIEF